MTLMASNPVLYPTPRKGHGAYRLPIWRMRFGKTILQAALMPASVS